MSKAVVHNIVTLLSKVVKMKIVTFLRNYEQQKVTI